MCLNLDTGDTGYRTPPGTGAEIIIRPHQQECKEAFESNDRRGAGNKTQEE